MGADMATPVKRAHNHHQSPWQQLRPGIHGHQRQCQGSPVGGGNLRPDPLCRRPHPAPLRGHHRRSAQSPRASPWTKSPSLNWATPTTSSTAWTAGRLKAGLPVTNHIPQEFVVQLITFGRKILVEPMALDAQNARDALHRRTGARGRPGCSGRLGNGSGHDRIGDLLLPDHSWNRQHQPLALTAAKVPQPQPFCYV